MKRLFKKIVIVILLFGTASYLPSCIKEDTLPTPPSLPMVKTANVSEITQTTALTGGTVTDDGGAEITDIGVCWSTSPNPTISSTKTSNGKGTGSFASSITGLTASTKYYVRAYATNSAGTSYGNEVTFNTNDIIIAPTGPILTTAAVTSITQTTALTGGTVTDDGGAEIIDIGVCWSTYPNPSISSTKTSNGKGTGSFASSITGLTASTKYYVRAYATNSAGTSYGNEVTFNTNDIIIAPTVPTLTTAAVTSITATSAVSGGFLDNEGGTITDKGICWGTSANPTLIDSKMSYDGLNPDFISNLVNLTPNTTYYVRAYATNAAGTGYGDQVSFITHQIEVATLTTISIQSITYISARSGGIITSDGGENITDMGICWGTTFNPTTNDNKMSYLPTEVASFYLVIKQLATLNEILYKSLCNKQRRNRLRK